MERPRIKRTMELVRSGGDVYVLRPDRGVGPAHRAARCGGARDLLDGAGRHAAPRWSSSASSAPSGWARRSRCSADAALLDDAADDARVPARDARAATTASCATSATSPPRRSRRRSTSAGCARRVSRCSAPAGWGAGRHTRSCAAASASWCSWTTTVSRRATSTGRSCTASATSAGSRSRRPPRRSRAFDSELRVVALERRHRGRGGRARRRSKSADLVVNSADWPAHDIERWVNAACFDAGVPFITLSHSPPVGRVGPMYAPGETGCFECQEATYRERYPLYDELVEQRAGEAVAGRDARAGLRVRGRPGGARGGAPPDGPGAPGHARALVRVRPPDDGGHARGRPRGGGLPGVRRRRGELRARDQSRAARRPRAFGPTHASGPRARDVVACERKAARTLDSPRPPFRPRSNVCSTTHNQISAPATRPRPGAWHRRWSFGAEPRYPPSVAPTTGG